VHPLAVRSSQTVRHQNRGGVIVRSSENGVLTDRRKDINRKFDTRGSRLKDVLGRLLYENRLGEEELRGLREEKMKSIRSFAQFLRDDARWPQ
jgi:hypothetical protein